MSLSKILYLRCLLLLTRLLLAHTYQAILVLLPKLINAPTKVHTGCVALWGSGVCLHLLFLLPFVLLCYADCYASSSTHTPLHIQLAVSFRLIFIGALPQTEKYVEQVEKSFFLK